ncbi:MAG: hypothetical protein IPO67_27495 [Deltaproteobacteria bacterium]|nr:hypothetical protein [Deltaproteobacteria bacterium]MBK9648851.1 hypothetical protein [Deltaproteobacteria bacterium]
MGIPHTPPARFEVEEDGAVVLPMDHPLAHDGVYLSCALVELAAQLAGRALGSSTVARAGVLVEVRELRLAARAVAGGTRLLPELVIERAAPPLPRVFVRLPGVLEARLTLKVAG